MAQRKAQAAAVELFDKKRQSPKRTNEALIALAKRSDQQALRNIPEKTYEWSSTSSRISEVFTPQTIGAEYWGQYTNSKRQREPWFILEGPKEEAIRPHVNVNKSLKRQ